jgi:hypothetical protein
MYHKKAAVPIIKVIAIIFTVTIFLISWILILNVSIAIDERKINSQLAIKKVIDGNCFSKDYATINKINFTQNKFENCYGKNDDILLRIKIENSEIYSNKEEFETQASKCSSTSTIKCTEMKYPIIYKNENKNEIKELTIQIITK